MLPERGALHALAAAVAICLSMGGTTLRAQTYPPLTRDELSPAQRRAIEQIALADARAALLDQVGNLLLHGGITVGGWTAREPTLERALQLWARGLPCEGKPRLYSDGVCACDLRLEPESLARELLRHVERHPESIPPELTTARIEAAARRWPVVWAGGQATLARPLRSRHPVGWENVTREGIELARRSAAADARAALLEQAGQLAVVGTRQLREFFAVSDAIRAAVEADIERAAEVRTRVEPDQVAIAEAELELRELIRILTRAHQEHYQGGDFAVADFRDMALHADLQRLQASGLGVPPARTVLRVQRAPLELDAPQWAGSSLKAAGRFVPTDRELPDDECRRQAAHMDAMDRLRRQVEQLVIRDDVTVARFVSYHQDLKPDVVLFLTGARITAPPEISPDGGVSVSVELPLRRLWDILRRRMTLEEGNVSEDARGAGAAPRASRPPGCSRFAGWDPTGRTVENPHDLWRDAVCESYR